MRKLTKHPETGEEIPKSTLGYLKAKYRNENPDYKKTKVHDSETKQLTSRSEIYYKQMVVDDETGEFITRKQKKNKPTPKKQRTVTEKPVQLCAELQAAYKLLNDKNQQTPINNQNIPTSEISTINLSTAQILHQLRDSSVNFQELNVSSDNSTGNQAHGLEELDFTMIDNLLNLTQKESINKQRGPGCS